MKKLADEDLKQSYIKKYDLFSYFTMDMSPFMELFKFNPNEMILEANKDLEYLFFHVEGSAEIYLLLENDNLLLRSFSRPLTILGEVEIWKRKIQCNVKAVTDCFLVGIPIDKIIKFCDNDPLFLKKIVQELNRKIFFVNKMTPVNLYYPLENRLASYILATIIDEEFHLYLNALKINQIANLLGASLRQTSRVICKFEREGYLERKAGKIKIINAEGLLKYGNAALYL